MKRLLLLAVCVATLPGCLASLGMQAGNTGAPATQPGVGPGGSISSSSVNARIGDASALGAVVGVAVLGVLLGGEQSGPPELDASRTINEQDCTKPVEDSGANLRCR